ncbi:MAG: TetR family transcriptional regulator [Actinobacteria bacterium 13_2_20CM_2_71_6]|nr:MAG: TetR family transcriptional regulator [Actinobacteria bacterium 13_2_20CM_2_71_6]
MGHREDLLVGAKRCLHEKGYARTTARDIVAASGTNLASIGYHYGSKEALMNAALFDAIGEFGDELERAMAADLDPDATPIQRFEAYWTRVLDSFAAHRQLWSATFEIFGQIDRVPAMRQLIADGLQQGREGWAMLLSGIDAAVEKEKAQAVGSFYQALLSGVLTQWLVDPERAPSGRDLADALRIISTSVATAEGAASA